VIRSYIGAYWGPRAQSVDECAELVAEVIGKMADVDPLLSNWRSGANSKSAAVNQAIVTRDRMDIVERLLGGRNRTDTDHEVIEDLGYSVGWWNGSDDKKTAIDLRIHIGAKSTSVLNSVVLRLPAPAAAPNLYTRGNADKLVRTIIATFDPEHAVWTNHSLTKRQSEPDRPTDDGGFILGELVGHPAGWATYLADCETNHLKAERLPSSARIERVARGTLVTLAGDPAEPLVEDVLQVRSAMGYPVAGTDSNCATKPSSVSPTQPPHTAPVHSQHESGPPQSSPNHGADRDRAHGEI
jgi:hypothetical protein